VDAGIRPLRRHRGISAGGGTHAPPIHVRGHLQRRGPAGPVAALALLAKRWAQPARTDGATPPRAGGVIAH